MLTITGPRAAGKTYSLVKLFLADTATFGEPKFVCANYEMKKHLLRLYPEINPKTVLTGAQADSVRGLNCPLYVDNWELYPQHVRMTLHPLTVVRTINQDW